MTALLLASGFAGGILGSLLGIGGGMLLVPLLVLVFDMPMVQVVPASLLCVAATSCGAAAAYLEQGLSNVRLALTLELATVAGAVGGGLAAPLLPAGVAALAFGVFALLVSVQMLLGRSGDGGTTIPSPGVRRLIGAGGATLAGAISSILGVGGGPLKVPLMNVGMGVPFKVASATSNLMIGVTAAASIIAYAVQGQLDLTLAGPLVVGALGGAALGSRLMDRTPVALLRRSLVAVLVIVASQMLWKGGSTLWPAS